MTARLHWSFSLLFGLLCVSLYSQDKLNIEKIGQLQYERGLNDIWGYTDPNGVEYALVGLDSGVSVVDISTPSAPIEKIRIDGPLTIWRDLKTWSHYAYVVHDIVAAGNTIPAQGLLIIDLDSLENPHFKQINLEVDLDTLKDDLRTAHNLYIDENGVCYVFGSNISNGGALLFDVATDPWAPAFLGIFDDYYLHDGMARGDTLWGAAVYRGYFSAIDVSIKSRPKAMATGYTPNLFTHNCWISDDGKTLFTTDERTDSYIGAFDVSNLSRLRELGRIQRLPGTDVVPHNVHVYKDWLVTSYYSTGLQIVNAKRPELMMEVGFYDTYPQDNGANFRGNWGAYPYFPSGLIAASDRDNGLFILQPDYKDLAYADFEVTDSLTGERLFSSEIYLTNDGNILKTNLLAKASKAVTYTGNDTAIVEIEGYQTRTVPFQYQLGTSRAVPIRLLKKGFTTIVTGDFIVFPNPSATAKSFSIAWPDVVVGERATLNIYSNLGQRVSSQSFVISPDNAFDTPEASGVYYIEVEGSSVEFSIQSLIVL